MCDENGALFHSDSVQSMGRFPLDVSKTKIHFLSGSGHKFHGPKGAGFVYINGDYQLKPFLDGGGQERNMRGGTENIYGILGIAKALELAYGNLTERRAHIESLRQHLIKGLRKNVEGIGFNGDFDGNYLYTVLSTSFPPSPKADLLVMNLDIAGIGVSGGSACSSGAEKGSHVLEAVGADPDRKAIRFSFSHYNTTEEVDFLIEKLKAIFPKEVVV